MDCYRNRALITKDPVIQHVWTAYLQRSRPIPLVGLVQLSVSRVRRCGEAGFVLHM